MAEYNARKAIKAQEEYTGNRVFAPSSGICWHCGRSIYEPVTGPDGHVSGYSVEDAARTVITDCPHCHYSFVN